MEINTIYFICYCIAFVVYGSMITAMGPIIPYFSELTGEPEPYYSFIFISRAGGYIVGGLLVKYLMERYSSHKILAGATVVGGFSFMLSTFSITFLNLSITLFIGAVCCCIINITCNVCVMQIYRGKSEDYWIQFLHLMFGIGGFIGPTVAAFTGIHCYFYLGIFLILLGPLFLCLSSPENRRSNFVTQIAQPISRTVEILICGLYFLYIGQQVGFGSWVSSYAVMEGVGNTEQAAFATSIFWTTNTLFRIVLLYVTVRVSLRLKVLMLGMIIGCIINFGADLTGHQWFAAYVGSFLNGMFLSSLFALFLALPLEFGYKLSKRNTANFMMCASLGQGAMTMPIGYAIGLLGPWVLFLMELIFAIISYLTVLKVLLIFQEEQKSTYLVKKEQEIQVSDNLYLVDP